MPRFLNSVILCNDERDQIFQQIVSVVKTFSTRQFTAVERFAVERFPGLQLQRNLARYCKLLLAGSSCYYLQGLSC